MMWRSMRLLGALAILAVGAVHLQQYIGADYRAIPTIGTSFMLNAIASGIVGLALLVPIERLLASRGALVWIGVFAVTAVGIAAGSLIALFISESGSLFGFSESGYRTPIIVAIVAEAATILLLAPVAAMSVRRARAGRGQATARHDRRRAARADYGAAR
jgi:multisubunit Na+/H+ antiporter MnhG subunit